MHLRKSLVCDNSLDLSLVVAKSLTRLTRTDSKAPISKDYWDHGKASDTFSYWIILKKCSIRGQTLNFKLVNLSLPERDQIVEKNEVVIDSGPLATGMLIITYCSKLPIISFVFLMQTNKIWKAGSNRMANE